MTRKRAKLPPGDPGAQVAAARKLLATLLEARTLAREAVAIYTLPRVEAAISSARGAIRGAKLRARESQ